MFEFSTDNKVISSSQSGFKPGDSCINQLLCITHNMYKSFDYGLEKRAVFLDISKAFDKFWHEVLLYKLKQNDISGNLRNIITDFLILIKQRVVFKGQYSIWVKIEAGVPQGCVLGPLFFLIYIYDFSDDFTSNPKLFADDTFLFCIIQNLNSTSTDLNSGLIQISDWAFQAKMNLNPDPNKQAQEVIFKKLTKLIILRYSLIKI